MGEIKSPYLELLEDFHKVVTHVGVETGMGLRLREYERCVKAKYLLDVLDKLFKEIEDGNPVLDDFGIDYEEWYSDEKWKDVNGKISRTTDEITENDFVEYIDKKYEDYKQQHPEIRKETPNIPILPQTFINKKDLIEGFSLIDSASNISDYVLDIVFKEQLMEIRTRLSDIYNSRQTQMGGRGKNKISDDKYAELFDGFDGKNRNRYSLSKYTSELNEIKKDYPEDLKMGHYRMMLKPYILNLVRKECLGTGIDKEIVEQKDKAKYIKELKISETDSILDLEDDDKLRMYHRFRRLFEYKENTYMIDKIKIGKHIYKYRDVITPEVREDFFKQLVMIDLIQKDMDEMLNCISHGESDVKHRKAIKAEENIEGNRSSATYVINENCGKSLSNFVLLGLMLVNYKIITEKDGRFSDLFMGETSKCKIVWKESKCALKYLINELIRKGYITAVGSKYEIAESHFIDQNENFIHNLKGSAETNKSKRLIDQVLTAFEIDNPNEAIRTFTKKIEEEDIRVQKSELY